MANSGSVSTPMYQNKKITFNWYVDNINNDTRTGTVHWSLYVEANDGLYHLLNGGAAKNYFNINGSRVYERGNTYNSGGKTVYNGYTSNGYLSNREYYDQNGNYTGVKRWVYGIRDLASGTFTIYYNEDGNANFSVGGQFKWYSSAHESGVINQTFYLNQIETYSKVNASQNKGSNWNKNKYIYKTTNYGANWSKCNLYKTTNGGSNWSKVR